MNYEKICRDAWNATKKDTQPFYDSLVESYRGLLLARAEKAIREKVTSGDMFDNFERQAMELSGEPAKEPAKELVRVIDEPQPEPEVKPKKTAKKLAAVKKAVKVIKKAAKKGKK